MKGSFLSGERSENRNKRTKFRCDGVNIAIESRSVRLQLTFYDEVKFIHILSCDFYLFILLHLS